MMSSESTQAVLVNVPDNARPGSVLVVRLPNDNVVRITVPSGYYAGSSFMFYYNNEGNTFVESDSVARNLFPADDDDDDDDEAMRRYLRGLHDPTPELKGSYVLPAEPLPNQDIINLPPFAECDLIPMAEAYYESELETSTDRQIAFGAKILASLDDDGEDRTYMVGISSLSLYRTQKNQTRHEHTNTDSRTISI